MAYYNSYMQPVNYQMPGYNVPSQPVPPVVQQSYAPAPMGSNVIPVDGEEEPVPMLPNGQSGAAPQIDTSQFVTKSDMEDFKRELMNTIRQNGNPPAQNNNNNARRQ